MSLVSKSDLKMSKISLLLLLAIIGYVAGHGMLFKPAGRSTRWRFDSTAPPNWDDNQLWCGGLGVQHHTHGGRCGLCGDNFGDPTPRANEQGGRFGLGVIVGNYQTGSIIDVDVMITTNHRGHFVFELCNMDVAGENEACYLANRLRLPNGADRYEMTEYRTGIYNVALQLPQGLTCRQCSLRWTYVAANQWGQCGDGTSGLGCGPQEHFRSCSDISISWNARANTGHIYEHVTPFVDDIKAKLSQ